MSPTIYAYGEQAILVEYDDVDTVRGVYADMRARPLAGVRDLVPAARTIGVTFDPHKVPAEKVSMWASSRRPVPVEQDPADEVVLDVVYDGEDLAEVASLTGLSAQEVIAAHSGAPWTVAFGGFAPGFGYLISAEGPLDVPRRSRARTEVPAGAVGLAGRFSGVYPRSGPGGWQIIGRTNAELWDASRTPPALLSAGRTVRFRPCDSLPEAPAPSGVRTSEPAPAPTGRAMEVIAAGPLTLVEDRGRAGHADAGAPTSGALDRGALDLGNRILGNAPDTPGLEITAGGFSARFTEPAWCAITGARGTLSVDGAPIEPDMAVRVAAGSVLSIGDAEIGVRFYLSVRGGIAVAPVLGSASRDILTGLGPAPVSDGDVLPLGEPSTEAIPAIDTLVVPPPVPGPLTIYVHDGPRADWFTEEAVTNFFDERWVVSPQSNRVGVRLEPTSSRAGARDLLERAIPDELPSEAMVAGAIQVPPHGSPTVLLADHPVTGGYPVIAVVAERSLDAFAQVRPGQTVTFRHAHAPSYPQRLVV